ncbi:MAG: alpha/beta hydrolase [Ruminococcaceae bacterium]|jgi:hypothetical protein|nr:alpha/beta hydrolase [Oscillospiraceae bacterium]
MRIFFWILGILAVLFLLFTVVGGYLLYYFTIRRDDRRSNKGWDEPLKPYGNTGEEEFARMREGEAFLKGRMAEFVTLTSRDGLTLWARYFAHPEPRGIFLMVHGYRSSSIQDFSGAVLPIWNMGYSLFMIDQRAMGRSEGKALCFGIKERYDVIDWANYLKERFPDLPVVADGVSMGSGTVLYACGLGWPDNVKAVIADCGYSSPGAICRKCMKQWYHLPPFPIYYCAKLWTRILAGIDLDSINARECLEKLKDRSLYPKPLPILLAHGRKDGFVPYEMSEENMKAFGPKDTFAELFTSDTADHGMAFLRDYDGYMEAIGRLFDKAGLPHEKVEVEEFVPETPIEELTRPDLNPGGIYTVN